MINDRAEWCRGPASGACACARGNRAPRRRPPRGVPVNLDSGRPTETAETVRGTGTGAPSEAGRLLESRTGDGAPLQEADSGGESSQRAAGDRRTVRVPGEAKHHLGSRLEVWIRRLFLKIAKLEGLTQRPHEPAL